MTCIRIYNVIASRDSIRLCVSLALALPRPLITCSLAKPQSNGSLMMRTYIPDQNSGDVGNSIGAVCSPLPFSTRLVARCLHSNICTAPSNILPSSLSCSLPPLLFGHFHYLSHVHFLFRSHLILVLMLPFPLPLSLSAPNGAACSF